MFYLLLILLVPIKIKVHCFDLSTSSIITAGPTYSFYQFNVLQHLTALSPYFESNVNELSPDPPQGCTVDKAVYLIRHGSINGNDYDYSSIISPFLQRLKNSSSNNVNFSQSVDLAFLAQWISPIPDTTEQLEELTTYGAFEAFNLGTQLADRYPNLVPNTTDTLFKVWAAEANRTKQTASLLLAGLHGGQASNNSIVVDSEAEDQGTNTLEPTETCLSYNVSAGSDQANSWLKQYTIPIITRLNAQKTGFSFTANDILAMQELCGYETVIRNSSSFCRIFTPEEWLAFEYYFDIKYYYSCGYGNNLSPSLGMPWIVAASVLLNYTTDTSQDLYLSVSHREILLFAVTALGLYNDSAYMSDPNNNPMFPLDQINYHRTWKTSKFATALSHLALERLDCVSAAYTGRFVRILINSAPQPVPGCTNGPGASCPLMKYLDYINHQNESFASFSNACHLKSQAGTHFLILFSKMNIGGDQKLIPPFNLFSILFMIVVLFFNRRVSNIK